MNVPAKATRATLLGLTILLAACGAGTGESRASDQARPAASAASTAKPSEAATATSRPMELVGKFSLSPAHGPLGTAVTASATGLKPQTRYDVVWTSASGAWKLSEDRASFLGRAYTPVEVPVKTVFTDAAGAFTLPFAVPSVDFGFQHDVLVIDEGKVIRNKSGFQIDLQVTISPTSGPVGTPITIEARGIGWRPFEGSWLVAYDNHFTGLLSAVTTKGVAKAVIPAAGSPGVHDVTVLGGDLTFMYLNVRQGPFPDRPEFRLPFTITEGPAVMPRPFAEQRAAVVARNATERGIRITPASGIVGSAATIAAAGLTANSDVVLTYFSQVGNRVAGSGFTEQGKPLGTTRTDASGSFSWNFSLPLDLGGLHKVIAKIGDTVVGESQFTIQPNVVSISPSQGPSGTLATIHMLGVGWTETANIYTATYDNGYMGYVCGFNSAGDVSFTLAMSGEKGWHFVDLYPGIYKGTETQPFNYRMPQLTAVSDHPGEDLPTFRVAFLITD